MGSIFSKLVYECKNKKIKSNNNSLNKSNKYNNNILNSIIYNNYNINSINNNNINSNNNKCNHNNNKCNHNIKDIYKYCGKTSSFSSKSFNLTDNCICHKNKHYTFKSNNLNQVY